MLIGVDYFLNNELGYIDKKEPFKKKLKQKKQDMIVLNEKMIVGKKSKWHR